MNIKKNHLNIQEKLSENYDETSYGCIPADLTKHNENKKNKLYELYVDLMTHRYSAF